jgi:hypothetical protein
MQTSTDVLPALLIYIQGGPMVTVPTESPWVTRATSVTHSTHTGIADRMRAISAGCTFGRGRPANRLLDFATANLARVRSA